MDAHRGLAILEGRELLRLGGRDRAVARDDPLDQAAHGLQPERQRRDVEQQHVTGALIARQRVGQARRAQRHRLVGIEVEQRLAPENLPDGAPDERHSRGAADEDDAVDVAARQPGLAKDFSHGRDGAPDEGLRHGFEVLAADLPRDAHAGDRAFESCLVALR